ncbi:hypothetical protein evm_006686 [Chilo suppressalis]|nr:hypothetical protein evm_006686 [Chilo suppressalis]
MRKHSGYRVVNKLTWDVPRVDASLSVKSNFKSLPNEVKVEGITSCYDGKATFVEEEKAMKYENDIFIQPVVDLEDQPLVFLRTRKREMQDSDNDGDWAAPANLSDGEFIYTYYNYVCLF